MSNTTPFAARIQSINSISKHIFHNTKNIQAYVFNHHKIIERPYNIIKTYIIEIFPDLS